MAGFQGFGYKAPEEIIAETQAGFQRALQSGDPNQMRAAIAQQAAFAIGGSPELKKARKTDKVLKEAYRSAPDTGDEVADQIAFYKQAQKAAVDAELPEIALQATNNLGQLRLMQEERSRLRNAEGRAQAAEARVAAEDEREKKKFGLAYNSAARQVLVTPEGEYITTVDVTSPEGAEAIAKLQEAGEEFTWVSEADWFNATMDEKLAAARQKAAIQDSDLPETTKNRFNQLSVGQNTFRTAMDQLVDLIDEGPEGLSAGGKAGAVLNRLGTEARQIVGLNQSEEEQNAIIAAADRKYNLAESRLRGAVINLAYALASAREGGKLSESDVLLALQTLGVDGQPDPAAALTVLRDGVERNAETWRGIPESIIGFKNSPQAMDVWGTNQTKYDELLGKFDDRIAKWSDPNKQVAQPAATTPTSSVESDLSVLFPTVPADGNN